MASKNSETLALYCPTCNVQVDTDVVGGYSAPMPREYVIDDEAQVNVIVYRLSRCNRCYSPFLTRQQYLDVGGEFSVPQEEPATLYPVLRTTLAVENLPMSVQRTYLAAVATHRSGLYEPCAIMCRKCVEAVCRDLQARGGSLLEKLQDLQQGNVIDQRLLLWADELRLIGNEAAHDFDTVIGKEDAGDALDFLEGLLQYIFVLSRRFNEFQKRRRQRSEESAGPGQQSRRRISRWCGYSAALLTKCVAWSDPTEVEAGARKDEPHWPTASLGAWMDRTSHCAPMN